MIAYTPANLYPRPLTLGRAKYGPPPSKETSRKSHRIVFTSDYLKINHMATLRWKGDWEIQSLDLVHSCPVKSQDFTFKDKEEKVIIEIILQVNC